MKRLNRSEKPKCLDNYKHGKNNWKDVSREHKTAIWINFNQMQKGLCAYCECKLVKKQIEHFKNKDLYPRETFLWSNLFGSCDERNRCGHYKDSKKAKPYNISNILKPDEDEVDKYFIFLTNGEIAIEKKLSVEERFRASETIRVFHLNGDTTLVNRRKSALKSILPNITTLYDFLGQIPADEWQNLLENEINELKNSGSEFQTALVHAWEFNQAYE